MEKPYLMPADAASFPPKTISIRQSELDLLIRKSMAQAKRVEIAKLTILNAQIKDLQRQLDEVRTQLKQLN